MPYSFNIKGICVLCGEKTLVSPRVKKCEECTRAKQKERLKKCSKSPEQNTRYNKKHMGPKNSERRKQYNLYRLKRYHESMKDPRCRIEHNKKHREHHHESMKDPEYVERRRIRVHEHQIRKGNLKLFLHNLEFNKHKRK